MRLAVIRRMYARVADYLPSWVGWTVVILVVFGPPCVLAVSCSAVWSKHSANEAARDEREQQAEAERRELVRSEGPAVHRDFAAGTFRQGDAVDELLTRHTPDFLIRHHPYATLYYPGNEKGRIGALTVIARDGRLESATTAVRGRDGVYYEVNFFGGLLTLDVKTYSISLQLGLDRKLADIKNGLLAVAGFGATILIISPCPDGPGPEK